MKKVIMSLLLYTVNASLVGSQQASNYDEITVIFHFDQKPILIYAIKNSANIYAPVYILKKHIDALDDDVALEVNDYKYEEELVSVQGTQKRIRTASIYNSQKVNIADPKSTSFYGKIVHQLNNSIDISLAKIEKKGIHKDGRSSWSFTEKDSFSKARATKFS